MSAEGNDIAQLLAPTCLRHSTPQSCITACGDTDMLLFNMLDLWLSGRVSQPQLPQRQHGSTFVSMLAMLGDAFSYILDKRFGVLHSALMYWVARKHAANRLHISLSCGMPHNFESAKAGRCKFSCTLQVAHQS